MLNLKKELLKETFIKPDWFVEIQIVPAWKPPLKLQYFGNLELGGFNLHCDLIPLEQKKFKLIELPSSVCSEIAELINSSHIAFLDCTQPSSGWAVLDGANYYLKIQTAALSIAIERIASEPEIELKEFINEMLARCSVLETEKVIAYYQCY